MKRVRWSLFCIKIKEHLKKVVFVLFVYDDRLFLLPRL